MISKSVWKLVNDNICKTHLNDCGHVLHLPVVLHPLLPLTPASERRLVAFAHDLCFVVEHFGTAFAFSRPEHGGEYFGVTWRIRKIHAVTAASHVRRHTSTKSPSVKRQEPSGDPPCPRTMDIARKSDRPRPSIRRPA